MGADFSGLLALILLEAGARAWPRGERSCVPCTCDLRYSLNVSHAFFSSAKYNPSSHVFNKGTPGGWKVPCYQ